MWGIEIVLKEIPEEYNVGDHRVSFRGYLRKAI